MVGGRTLLGEDPRLTVRDPGLVPAREQAGRSAQPAKVGVVSRIGRPGDRRLAPHGSRFLHDGGGRVLVCTSSRTERAAIDWLRTRAPRSSSAAMDASTWRRLSSRSRELGIEQLMVEGGSTLVAALLEAGLVDELQLAVAPLLFGGETAPTPVGGRGWPRERGHRPALAERPDQRGRRRRHPLPAERGGTGMSETTDALDALEADEQLPPTPPTGLTDAEAAERRAQGLGNSAPPSTTRTYAAIVRENVFTFVNNVLFLLGLALVIVGRPFDAFVSLGVIGTNIVVGIYQEVRAKQALDEIALLTRPTATVVRDGEVRTVPPEELVVGDLIEVGAGDQIVVDGELTEGRMEVDESQLTGESDMVPKRVGDQVFSGSYPDLGLGPLRGPDGR